jgi:hypothetical protein
MIVTVVDPQGRRSAFAVPHGAEASTWSSGILLGPPDLSELGLPEEVTTRLHNELFVRGVTRRSDAKAKRADVLNALQAALRVDAQRIIDIYEANGN